MQTFFMRSIPPMVRNIIVVSSVCFLLNEISKLVFHSYQGILTFYFGLLPVAVVKSGWIWQLGTYLFLHGDIWHLLFNMLALWMFGSPIEGIWGGRRFLKYFLITGIGAGIASVILSFNSGFIIGSSGAVYGILAAFAVMFPEAELLVFFLFPMKAKHYCILFGVIELYFSLSSPGDPIAHVAHLSGMVIGYFMLKPPRSIFTLLGRTHFSSSSSKKKLSFLKKPKHLTIVPPKQQSSTNPIEDEFQKKVDLVLDKIRIHGMDSLSQEERQILESASSRLKEQSDDI